MKISLFSLFILMMFKVSMAQQPCGTFEYENYLNSKYSGFSEALLKTRQNSLNQTNALHKAGGNDTIYRIPVVFHIVWNTNEQNTHDSLIYSQMKLLNGAYRHSHKDTGAVRNLFKPLAGDSKIEFYLAEKDPQGNPVSGINRVKTNRTDFNNGFDLYGEAVKSTASQGIDAWDPNKYLNCLLYTSPSPRD